MVKFTAASACQRMGGLLLVLLGALALTSCGPLTHASPAAHQAAPASLPHVITFDSGTSYAQALREVTDHGIQPGETLPIGVASW